jgi:hypothetical protein
MTRGVARPLPPAHIGHEFIDVFELLQGRPSDVLSGASRTGSEPDRKRFREVFVRVALRVPEAEMLDVPLAGGIGPVILGYLRRRLPEELLPPTPALQLVRMLKGVPGLVAHDPHAFGA